MEIPTAYNYESLRSHKSTRKKVGLQLADLQDLHMKKSLRKIRMEYTSNQSEKRTTVKIHHLFNLRSRGKQTRGFL